jgi:hypothetical protein
MQNNAPKNVFFFLCEINTRSYKKDLELLQAGLILKTT